MRKTFTSFLLLSMLSVSAATPKYFKVHKSDGSSQTDPTGPSIGSDRVGRGGSWCYDATYCRVSIRYYATPGDQYNNLGFRLVLCP